MACRNRGVGLGHVSKERQAAFNSAGYSGKSCSGHDVLIPDMVKPTNIQKCANSSYGKLQVSIGCVPVMSNEPYRKTGTTHIWYIQSLQHTAGATASTAISSCL